VFVRLWEYEVPGDRVAAFTTAYAADGAWGELFGRAAGFLGTELYRDAVRADRFLTIDRWQTERTGSRSFTPSARPMSPSTPSSKVSPSPNDRCSRVPPSRSRRRHPPRPPPAQTRIHPRD